MKNKNRKFIKSIGIFEIFVTSLMLASKYLNDRNASNSAWSRISGIPLETLNKMEMKLLSFIEYKLHVEVDLFDRWIKFLFQPAKITNFLEETTNEATQASGEQITVPAVQKEKSVRRDNNNIRLSKNIYTDTQQDMPTIIHDIDPQIDRDINRNQMHGNKKTKIH